MYARPIRNFLVLGIVSHRTNIAPSRRAQSWNNFENLHIFAKNALFWQIIQKSLLNHSGVLNGYMAVHFCLQNYPNFWNNLSAIKRTFSDVLIHLRTLSTPCKHPLSDFWKSGFSHSKMHFLWIFKKCLEPLNALYKSI